LHGGVSGHQKIGEDRGSWTALLSVVPENTPGKVGRFFIQTAMAKIEAE